MTFIFVAVYGRDIDQACDRAEDELNHASVTQGVILRNVEFIASCVPETGGFNVTARGQICRSMGA